MNVWPHQSANGSTIRDGLCALQRRHVFLDKSGDALDIQANDSRLQDASSRQVMENPSRDVRIIGQQSGSGDGCQQGTFRRDFSSLKWLVRCRLCASAKKTFVSAEHS